MTASIRTGRPDDLESRLAAITDILAPEGISHARSTMHAFAWWDEVLSPAIGAEVQTVGWMRTPDGPRSVAVDAVLDRWAAEGLWRRPESLPLLSESMEAAAELRRRGAALCGVAPRTMHHAPADFTPWYGMLCGLAEAMHVGGKPSVSSFSDARDIRAMLRACPVFLADPWEVAGGPAAVHLTSENRLVPAGVTGNSAGLAMACWRAMPRDGGGARDVFQAAWRYGRLLVNRAVLASPEFGEARFLDISDRLTVRETTQPDGTVTAVFSERCEVVAHAAWRPGTRPKSWPGRDGGSVSAAMPDGELLDLEVAEAHRGQGIGTYVMRHALTRGCVRAPAPPEGAGRLWGHHGWPQADGSWVLHGMEWPTCQMSAEPSSSFDAPVRRFG